MYKRWLKVDLGQAYDIITFIKWTGENKSWLIKKAIMIMTLQHFLSKILSDGCWGTWPYQSLTHIALDSYLNRELNFINGNHLTNVGWHLSAGLPQGSILTYIHTWSLLGITQVLLFGTLPFLRNLSPRHQAEPYFLFNTANEQWYSSAIE